jgi:hypothetical protein
MVHSYRVVPGFHHFERKQPIPFKDLEEALRGISYMLKLPNIVLIHADANKHILEQGGENLGARLPADSMLWLIE